MTACQYCSRRIVRRNGTWIDPAATGDDSLWRETCEGNDTFAAEHAPDTPWTWNKGWRHCETPAETDDDGVTCRKCYRFLTWGQADELMAE